MYMLGDYDEILQFINPECVNKDSLLCLLDIRGDYDETIIDNLYIKKILNIDEYIKYMERVYKRKEDELKDIKSRISEAKEKGEKFEPHMFYCCCGNPFGE